MVSSLQKIHHDNLLCSGSTAQVRLQSKVGKKYKYLINLQIDTFGECLFNTAECHISEAWKVLRLFILFYLVRVYRVDGC